VRRAGDRQLTGDTLVTEIPRPVRIRHMFLKGEIILYVGLGRRGPRVLLVQGLAGNPQKCTHDTIRDVGDRSSLSRRILVGLQSLHQVCTHVSRVSTSYLVGRPSHHGSYLVVIQK
jgi:hypothetical protein